MAPRSDVPHGPRAPRPLQTVGLMLRQRPWLERARRRYGNLFTIHVIGLGRCVIVADPALVKQVFTADPATLHAGSGSPLRAVLGHHSLLSIDEERHLEQRRILLPPFRGQRMQAYEPLIAEIAAEEIDRWPEGVEIPTDETFMRITLRAILRAVFGAEGAELTALEELMPGYVERASRMASLSFLQRDLGPWSPWGRVLRDRAEFDRRTDALIEKARRDPALEQRVDVLALLVQARHGDGSPMANEEIRDQLLTLLAAGHETTAGTLAWAVERLSRHPQVTRRLVEEVDAGGGELRTAAIREVQRTRPTIAFAGRTVRQPFELAGHPLPLGTRVLLAATLTHYDPALFARPDRFDPDRFIGVNPETYAWIPFGGGIRRCLGAAFAHMEMDVVLRTLLGRVELVPSSAPDERWHFRGVAHVPADGGRVVVRRRVPRGASVGAPSNAAVAA